MERALPSTGILFPEKKPMVRVNATKIVSRVGIRIQGVLRLTMLSMELRWVAMGFWKGWKGGLAVFVLVAWTVRQDWDYLRLTIGCLWLIGEMKLVDADRVKV